ncbi:hypothetical protein WDV76_16725 [Xenorhabdus griffiniae]|uniref:hypothetical protein n=1 Tax=Xenorhabdus griffiniae TaxID=351672 RepID=UPI0030CECC70
MTCFAHIRELKTPIRTFGLFCDVAPVLIPDSDDTRTIKQQYQRQQDQLSEIKLKMRELLGDYNSN